MAWIAKRLALLSICLGIAAGSRPADVPMQVALGAGGSFQVTSDKSSVAEQNATAEKSATVFHPTFIVGPLLGQTLLVKDSRWFNLCSLWNPKFLDAWISKSVHSLVCAIEGGQLWLNWDDGSHLSSPVKDVQVKVAEGWDGLSLYGVSIHSRLVERLEQKGFVKDKTIFPMAYDWRLSVEDWRKDAFPRFLKLVETAVTSTGQKAVFSGVSMAGPFTHAFLTWAKETQGPDWSSKNVHSWVPIAAPWNGAVNALLSLLGGSPDLLLRQLPNLR